MNLTAFAEAAAAREGISVIWKLHLAAARANRDAHPLAALSIIQIADAAERLWIKRSGVT